MNIVPSDSKYIPLTQQKWCCVPTCFQMIMLKHNIPLVPAELIGYHMGLIVPEDNSRYFWHPRVGPRPEAGYGTQAGKKEYGPNHVFKKLGIPLKVSWNLINKFKTIDAFKDYLAKLERSSLDILICFDWGQLFNEPEYQGGHVCVLDKVYLDKHEIRIIDPDYNSPKWQIIRIDTLYKSMQFHGVDNSAGFWEVQYIG
jgi:hypothetical protein